MNMKADAQGFSLVEMMVATFIALIVSYSILEIYLAQTQTYKTSNSQELILNTENALTHLVSPVIRSAGFMGCGTISSVYSILNSGGPDPINSLNTNPIMLLGYNGSGSSITLPQENPANDTTASDWSPSLPSSLVGQIEGGNDVLIVLGATPYSQPMNVITITPGSSTFSVQTTSGNTLSTGQFGTISDCTKALVFYITSIAGNTIGHGAGTQVLTNSGSSFPFNFQPGAQFMPLQQTAFFVGQSLGGQSALMRGILTGSTWTIQPIIPGIEFMKVQYGIGQNGTITQYVSANSVSNWAQVYSVRIGFLISGRPGSGTYSSGQYSVLNTTVTTPADGRLRHVFEMTINLRNALS